MEQRDLELLDKHAGQDAELNALWEEHQLYEQQVGKLESKQALTPNEERALKEIKKKKLNGKTKIQNILERYRQAEK